MANKKVYRFFNSKLTSAISVSMVLFLLGCTITVSLVAKQLTDSVLERIAVTVYMKNKIADEEVESFRNFLNHQPYTKEASFISKEQAIKEVCDEIGEDPSMFDSYNTLPNTFVVYLTAPYANNDSIAVLSDQIKELNCVDRVEYQKNMIRSIVRNINNLTYALLSAALVLLIISYVLIHNTIVLLVHSDRFIIHTMKLVGATGRFILKPYLLQSLGIALVAFVLAVMYIFGLNYFFRSSLPFSMIDMGDVKVFIPLFGTLLLCSILITSIATFFAVKKYLNKQVDNLYYM